MITNSDGLTPEMLEHLQTAITKTLSEGIAKKLDTVKAEAHKAIDAEAARAHEEINARVASVIADLGARLFERLDLHFNGRVLTLNVHIADFRKPLAEENP